MHPRLLTTSALSVAVLMSAPALAAHSAGGAAESDPPASPTDAPAPHAAANTDRVVTGHRLDAARASIQPSLGATSYEITNATIQALPGGDNQQLNQIALQLPGVVQDGFGQFHVRDDHNNLQYRINGTILPEGVAVFGQTLSPRLIDKFSLLTGALPAQYGLRTAGIIDITTKSGFQNQGSASIYGGSHGTIEPSIEYGGASGSTNYFVSGDYKQDDLGIESVEGSANPLHDHTRQGQVFAYIDHIIDPENRISFLGGYSNQYFEIPNPRGLQAGGFLSDNLNERQLEKTGFGQLALLHNAGPLTLQTALFARLSTLNYRPDTQGELAFNGQAQAASKTDFTTGLQLDAAEELGQHHTLRGGFLVTRDRGVSQTSTLVFAADGSGQPFAIPDNGTATEWTESAYLQDEWKLTPELTFNFGGRYDHYCGYRCEQQLSPRANLVWQPGTDTTLHAGYARYFSPPPFENVAVTSVAKFANTSAAAPTTTDTIPFAERQHYFDIGIQQKLGRAITFGVDGYYRISKNLVDEGQFGAPIVLTPFNYARGRIKGIEANVSYHQHGLMIYGNFAYAKAQGKNIISSQFNFSPDDLAVIKNQYIYLDHDQTYTGSAGASYHFADGALRGLELGASMLYGSGLRANGAVPNGGKLPAYVQGNLSASYDLPRSPWSLRLDIINVADNIYNIRNGSGVGVGAPEFGPRRGFFAGVTRKF
jgi:outer membrane receptor for ferrienterochelin and colicins